MGQLSLIFGTSLRDIGGFTSNRGLSWESTGGGLRLWHMLGVDGFRSKKVSFIGTSTGEGWFIWIRKLLKASLGLTGNP